MSSWPPYGLLTSIFTKCPSSHPPSPSSNLASVSHWLPELRSEVKSYKSYKSLEAIKREYIAPSEKVKYQSPIFKSRLNGLIRKYGNRGDEMTDRKLLEAYFSKMKELPDKTSLLWLWRALVNMYHAKSFMSVAVGLMSDRIGLVHMPAGQCFLKHENSQVAWHALLPSLGPTPTPQPAERDHICNSSVQESTLCVS